jgi:hypothetical protein
VFDAGSNDWAEGLVYDQRRRYRYVDGNLDGMIVADIGAYEAEADEYFANL